MRDIAAPPPPPRVSGGDGRKKSVLVQAWLVVDSTGQAEVVEAGKHAIMQRTGLPARDLRILDPALSYPSSVLGRERAIVVNLEHIKSIITSREMIFQNFKDPLVNPFVEKIQGIFRHRQTVMSTQESGWESMVDGGDHIYTGRVHDINQRLKLLPFEFVALETCLDATCTSLDDQARRLEEEAYPALDKLTSKIGTLNLDRVRNIKSRLVSITGRVEKVRDQLEHLLDDDKDMAEMHLTEKSEEDPLHNSSTCSINDLDILNDLPEEEEEEEEEEDYRTDVDTKNFDVKELEMILETYFGHIEGTLNKLYTLREYVDDTEDYINIMLDGKQNHLLEMDVKLKTSTTVVAAFVAMTGVFGMNIGKISLFDDTITRNPEFLWTVAGGTIGCIVCFLVAMAWCSHHRIFLAP